MEVKGELKEELGLELEVESDKLQPDGRLSDSTILSLMACQKEEEPKIP